MFVLHFLIFQLHFFEVFFSFLVGINPSSQCISKLTHLRKNVDSGYWKSVTIGWQKSSPGLFYTRSQPCEIPQQVKTALSQITFLSPNDHLVHNNNRKPPSFTLANLNESFQRKSLKNCTLSTCNFTKLSILCLPLKSESFKSRLIYLLCLKSCHFWKEFCSILLLFSPG